MATLFNEEIFGLLTPIFVFIFLFTGIYILLINVKIFNEKPAFTAIIAFAGSMLVFIVPEAQIVTASFTSWMALLMLLVLSIFLIFMFLGVKNETLVDIAQDGGFVFWVVLVVIILFLIALSKAYGPFLMVNQTPGFWNATKRTIFHPKVLGVLFIFAVAAFTVRYLAANK
jgi:hypothetical protein